MRPIAISFGEILWDCFPDGAKTLGGAPLNFAYHCKRAGLDAFPVSALGNDEDGKLAAERIYSLGLDARFIQKKSLPTGKTLVRGEGADISYGILPGCAWEEISYDKAIVPFLERVAVVAYGTLAQEGKTSAQSLFKILASCPKGALRVFDANLRGSFYSRDRIVESLEFADALKLNEFEIGVFKGYFGLGALDDCAAAERILKIFRLKYLILTLGEKGSLIFGQDFRLSQKATETDIVDTVGAGDCFTATFIAAVSSGQAPQAAAQRAADAAAKVCATKGAFPKD